MDSTNAAPKLSEESNAASFTWNKFTEHQINTGWADSYDEIKKLLQELKGNHTMVAPPPPRHLRQVTISHAASTSSGKAKRAKTSKVP